MKSKPKTYKYIVSIIVIAVVAAVLLLSKSTNIVNTAALPAGAAQYSNSDLGFSFYYPTEASVQEPPTDGGYMVTVADAKGNGSLQIFITPFSDPPSTLTADYIKAQVPDLVVDNPAPITDLSTDIKAAGGAGVSFSSTVNSQPVLEYWFAAGTGEAEHLYQMTATAGSGDLAQVILKSFRITSANNQ